ncbi:hypothetical protein GCM10027445_46170 [Amycolatopsis endophytica]
MAKQAGPAGTGSGRPSFRLAAAFGTDGRTAGRLPQAGPPSETVCPRGPDRPGIDLPRAPSPDGTRFPAVRCPEHPHVLHQYAPRRPVQRKAEVPKEGTLCPLPSTVDLPGPAGDTRSFAVTAAAGA